MKKAIFDYLDYKPYLNEKLTDLNQKTKGARNQFVQYIGCQSSYLSQVIHGKPELTLQQAFLATQFLSLDTTEANYFINLVCMSRAESKDLYEFFKVRALELKASRFNLKRRLKETDTVSLAHSQRYYSAWFYSAIHMALAVPHLNSVDLLAAKFNLPKSLVVNTIAFLEESGLVEKTPKGFVFSKRRIHLGRDSDFIQRHHINWRSQSLQSAEKNLKDDLHFSSVFAISKDDFEQVKEILVKAIEETGTVITPSNSEEVCAITIDLFKY